MRQEIEERTGGLTASAGIACNTLLAKVRRAPHLSVLSQVASDMNKPDGQHQVAASDDAILQFVAALPIRKVGGIGSVQEQMLSCLGVTTCGQLHLRRAEIKLLFSDLSFEFYMCVSQGLGATSLEPVEERERKSISTETTFKDTSARDTLVQVCRELSRDLAKEMQDKAILGLALTVKIKSHDFKQKTRVTQLCDYSNSETVIFEAARRTLVQMLEASDERPLALRLMGVRLSELRERSEVRGGRQASLLSFLPGGSRSARCYSCPACDQALPSLASLNSHMDLCVTGGGGEVPQPSIVTSVDLPGSPGQVCPVCEETLPSLEELNSHIDQCLVTRSAETGGSHQEEEGSKENLRNAANSGVDHLMSLQDGKREDATLTFECPVCLTSPSCKSEAAMALHVEECLSRREVRSLVMEERGAGAKRKRAAGSGATGSRSKIGKTATIHDFFTKC